jgi:hypothetical protein
MPSIWHALIGDHQINLIAQCLLQPVHAVLGLDDHDSGFQT